MGGRLETIQNVQIKKAQIDRAWAVKILTALCAAP
jgi:hypothetical protein